MAEANWYVVHTYSGYENKVKANIEKTIENRHLENQILEVRVPMEDVVEVKNGVKKQIQRKMFPGYVLLNMTKIESRPIVGRNWEYRFFLDFEGNLNDGAVKNALRGIREEAKNMKILGNY